MKMPEAEDAKTTGKGKKVATRKGSLEGEGPVIKLLQGIVEPLGDLKKSLRTGSTAVSALLGAITAGSQTGAADRAKSAGAYQLYIWGKLVAQQPKNTAMSVSLSGPSFSIGGNSRCSLTLSDPGISSSVVCKLQNSFTTGVVHIEGQTSRDILFVNRKQLKKGVKQPIKTGDEISIITKQQTYSFTFQKVRSPSKLSPTPGLGGLPTLPSLSLLAGGGHPHLSGLAPSHGLAGFPSTSPSASTSTTPSSSANSSSSSSSSQAASSASSSSSGGASAQQPAPEPADAAAHDIFGLGNLPMAFSMHRGSDLRRRAAARNSKRPNRGILTLKGGEIFGDHSPLGHPRSLILSAGFGGDAPASSASTAQPSAAAVAQKKACKEDLTKNFFKWQDITTTFEEFPYFVDNDTKQMLLNSAFAFIKKPDLVKHITDIPSISRRMLLAGPPGSEIYQEALVKAVARHLQANLFVFEGFKPVEPPAKTTAAATSAATPALSGAAPTDVAKDKPAGEGGKPAEETAGAATDAKAAEANPAGAATTAEAKEAANLPDRTLGSALSLASAISELLSVTASASTPAGIAGDHMDDDDADGEAGDEDEGDGELEGDMDAFDDMDEDEDSDADDDDDMEGDAWFGKRSDITKSRRTRFGPLSGLSAAGGYFGDGLHSKVHQEERDSQEKINVEALFELVTAEENMPCILYLKDTEKTLLTSYERYANFKRQLDKISAPLVVIGSSIVSSKGKGDKAPGGGFLLSKSGGGTTLLDFALFDHISRMEERARDTSKGARILSRLLPNKIVVNPPKEGPELPKWTKQISKDQQDMKQQQNRAAIRKVLEKNNIAIIEGEEGLRSRPLREQVFTSDKVEKIVGWAVGHHLVNSEQKGQEVRMDGTKLMLPATAIDHGIRMFNRIQPLATKTSLKDVQTDNDFERKLLAEAIPPNELAVRFEDIGALDKVKNTLKELVMLPLQRPELFRKGNLTKPCKGILLFGPPGTGKTMLAKAVATESGANFINCSMSSIGSKWFGEGEKYARAVFTLASKISPCVVFIDEVDSILGSREKSGEHEAMRKIKNEFMSMWDGLKTKENERVIVMAATNRPFDLDDAVLRRMPRRLLVDLPDAENRQKILRVILAKEELEPEFDFKAVGDMTDGFSGSDLKNLCISAAYMPIREIIEQEKKEGKEMDLTKKSKRSKKSEKGKEKADDAMVQEEEEDEDEEEEEEDPEEREPPVIRALGMEDFVKAKKENSASVHEDARAVGELRKWNEMYGEGGNARGKDLSYFL